MASSYSDPTAVFVVANANNDWRFERNPYATKMGGGIAFYAAANINLPVGIGASKRGVPNTLTSGAICLMDPTRSMTDESEFSQEDRAMLSDLAEMIARECTFSTTVSIDSGTNSFRSCSSTRIRTKVERSRIQTVRLPRFFPPTSSDPTCSPRTSTNGSYE